MFIKDLRTGEIQRASVAANGQPANGDSDFPRFSPDGNAVIFDSIASNLASGDTNDLWDVFIKDLRTGTLRRVSAFSDAEKQGGSQGVFSPNGARVAMLREIARLKAGSNPLCAVVMDLRSQAITPLMYSNARGERSCSEAAPAFLPDNRRVVFVGLDRRDKETLFVMDMQTGASSELLGEA